MKKTILILSAFVLALGLTQCKKEEAPATTNDNINNIDNGVRITLNVGNSSRANVDPNGNPNWATVSFEAGDYIYVGYNNAYVGYLECTSATTGTGYSHFEGTVTIGEVVEGGKLHFYMLGGKDFQPDPAGITGTQVSVNISDQSSKYPVISCATSNEDYVATTTTYTSDRLMNKCSIMKFDVTTPSSAAICITGMNNKVTLNFNPATEGTDEGFTYGIDTEDNGLIKMPAKDESNGTWAIVLPQGAYEEEGAEGTVYSEDHSYTGKRPVLPAIQSNKYLANGIAMTVTTNHIVDLATLTANYVAQDGDILTGTLAGNYQISIADGATVTLDGVNITNLGNNCNWAGINCPGDATIILKDGSNNTVCAGRDGGGYNNYPGIWIAPDKKLTIKGGGQLTAYSNNTKPYGAGIGGGYKIPCGNIEIQGGDINATGGIHAAGIGGGEDASCGTITISGGIVTATGGDGGAGIGSGIGASCDAITISGGTVTATGGDGGAGIGSGNQASCDAITISGGTVTATGGKRAAGIGSGGNANCGNIAITNGVTQVTATKGNDPEGYGLDNYYCIGAGYEGTCGTVTIGGTLDGDGNPVGGQTGPISTSPYTYQP